MTFPVTIRPSDWLEPDVETQASDHTDLQGPAEVWPERAIEPAPPLRYRVEFTAEQEYVDLVNEALDLLGHEKKAANLPDVLLRAMRELVTQRRAGAALHSRHIPAVPRRAVWARDEARCAYVHCRAERCRETRRCGADAGADAARDAEPER